MPKIEEAANNIVNDNRMVEAKMMKHEEVEDYARKFHERLETLPPQVEKVE